MRRFGFISGIFLYACVFVLLVPNFIVLADELKEDIEIIEDTDDFEDIEDDIDDFDADDDNSEHGILSDTYTSLNDFASTEEETPDIESGDDMNENEHFKIMVIFGFGMLSGLIVGNTLLRFIP